MTKAQLIPTDQLPAGATEGVTVDGVTLYRMGSRGWHTMTGASARIWAEVQAALPATPADVTRHGCIPAANWSGYFTDRQRAAFAARINGLKAAARKATAPARADRKASRSTFARELAAAAFRGVAQ